MSHHAAALSQLSSPPASPRQCEVTAHKVSGSPHCAPSPTLDPFNRHISVTRQRKQLNSQQNKSRAGCLFSLQAYSAQCLGRAKRGQAGVLQKKKPLVLFSWAWKTHLAYNPSLTEEITFFLQASVSPLGREES